MPRSQALIPTLTALPQEVPRFLTATPAPKRRPGRARWVACQSGSAGAGVSGYVTAGWGHIHTIYRDPTNDYADSVAQQAGSGSPGGGAPGGTPPGA